MRRTPKRDCRWYRADVNNTWSALGRLHVTSPLKNMTAPERDRHIVRRKALNARNSKAGLDHRSKSSSAVISNSASSDKLGDGRNVVIDLDWYCEASSRHR